MAIKGAKTIAEYAIREYLEDKFKMSLFRLDFISDCEAILTDGDGNTLMLKYDNSSRTVSIL